MIFFEVFSRVYKGSFTAFVLLDGLFDRARRTPRAGCYRAQVGLNKGSLEQGCIFHHVGSALN